MSANPGCPIRFFEHCRFRFAARQLQKRDVKSPGSENRRFQGKIPAKEI